MKKIAALIFYFFVVMAVAYGEEKPLQPYIDQLKKNMSESQGDSPSSNESYTESLKKKMNESQTGSEGYSERIKKQLLEEKNGKSAVPFTESEKTRLGPKDDKSAIQAVLDGKSELRARREGPIHHAFGLRAMASANRDITAGTSAHAYSEIYGTSLAPDVTFFWEYQPFHSEWFGNIGIIASGGFSFKSGYGIFEQTPANVGGGDPFPPTSHTKFQFFTLPISIGLDYRFNLMRVLRPFVMVAPTLIGYVETRDDSKSGFRGNSKGLSTAVGVSVLLDWMSAESAWDLYAAHGIKHSYLTVQYDRLSTFSGDVNFSVSGLSAGLTFEY